MRTFSEGRLARTIAYALTAAFTWSLGFVGVAALPAAAQVVTRAATTQSVAVIPFENRTSFRPETFGDEAAATVAVELRDRLLVDVLPKADVVLQMRTLGLKAPLSNAELIRLASELDVSLLLSGEVRGARIRTGPGGRYGEVVLAVRLFDRVAKVDTNGALVIGIGPASPDASDEVLLEKALQQAAFDAVEQMKARPTITAMVMWARGDVVFLNVGSRGGLRAGMHLVAVRGGERIGMVEVDSADAIGSYARVFQGPPLRTGDQLRAVYVLPKDTGRVDVGMSAKKKKTFESMVLLGAILLGFGNFASRARRVDEGDTAAPNFKASSWANGAEFGQSGYLWSFQWPCRDLQPHPAAVITWNAYQGTEAARIVGYEVRRSGQLVAVIVLEAGGQQLTILDTPQSPAFNTLEIVIDQNTGGLAGVLPEVEPWDPDYDPELCTFDSPSWSEFLSDHSDDAGVFITVDSITYGWFPSEVPGDDYGGMGAGFIYEYRIRPLLVRRIQEGVWIFDHGTEFSTTPNIVVGVSPAGTFSVHYVFQGYNLGVYEIWDVLPNPELAANQGTFFFYYPYGADDIVLQVARDPNVAFAPPDIANFSVPPILPTPPSNQTNITVNLSDVPGASPLFYWRVGARSSFDSNPPRVYPGGEPDEFGFTWSRRNSFLWTAPSRAALMHEQREALSAVRGARARVPRTAGTDRVLRAE